MTEFNDHIFEGIGYPVAYLHAIYNVVSERQPKRMLEIGFDQGGSALAMLYGSPNGELLSIEIAESVAAGAQRIQERITDWQERHMLMRSCDSRKQLPVFVEDGHEFDFIYIDGDHLYDAVKQDIENSTKLLAQGGVIMLDDADPQHGHFGVYQALVEFCSNNPGWQHHALATPSNMELLYRV